MVAVFTAEHLGSSNNSIRGMFTASISLVMAITHTTNQNNGGDEQEKAERNYKLDLTNNADGQTSHFKRAMFTSEERGDDTLTRVNKWECS